MIPKLHQERRKIYVVVGETVVHEASKLEAYNGGVKRVLGAWFVSEDWIVRVFELYSMYIGFMNVCSYRIFLCMDAWKDTPLHPLLL